MILILGFGSRQTAVMLGVWIVIDCCNGDLGLGFGERLRLGSYGGW